MLVTEWEQVQSRLRNLEKVRGTLDEENVVFSQRRQHLEQLQEVAKAQADLATKNRAMIAVANDIQVETLVGVVVVVDEDSFPS